MGSKFPVEHNFLVSPERLFVFAEGFRYQMRRFERFSENAAGQGIAPLQFLLLHINGYPGRYWATAGELAERLQANSTGVVALLTRYEAAGLVQRQPAHRSGTGWKSTCRLPAKPCSNRWPPCTVRSCNR